MKFKKTIKRILINSFTKKIFFNFLNEIITEPQFNQLFDRMIKSRSDNNKKSILDEIEYIGDNSFFWGNNHFVSKPEFLKIGENVHINDNCYIKSEGGVTIGDNTHISRNLLLYTVNHDFNGAALPYDEKMITKSVTIGKNVWIGMNVCIAPGTTIGDGAVIGMGTVVSGNVPPLSIIGMQKWRSIGNRNLEHYSLLENNKRYGGINGLLYSNYIKQLKLTGDQKVGLRSVVNLEEQNGIKVIRKKFVDSDDAKIAFENECHAINKLARFKWFPKVYEKGNDYIVYEYFDFKSRLDISISSFGQGQRINVLYEIITVLFDLYSVGVAHRDFYAKNLFYIEDVGVKLIDYETITEMAAVNFFDTYDIVGKGIDSPFLTGNMCVFNQHPLSIGKLFNIESTEQFRTIVSDCLQNRLYEISSSFFTRRYADKSRHNLMNRFIYNTFDLPLLKIGNDIGQRNIKQRLERFGVSDDLIKNKKILDIGSNIGGILLEVQKYEPQFCLGLEYDYEKVDIANFISKLNCINSVRFRQCDVESEDFIEGFDESFDVVFCLALIGHLKDQLRFLRKVYLVCNNILFIEGNANTDTNDTVILLQNAGFNQVEYIGLSNDEINDNNNNRPLFVCYK